MLIHLHYLREKNCLGQTVSQKNYRKKIKIFSSPNINLIAHKESGPFILERGEGIYVYDTDGNKYIEVWQVFGAMH